MPNFSSLAGLEVAEKFAYSGCSLGFEIRPFFMADSDPTIKSLDTDSAVGLKIADPVSRSEI